MLCRRYRLPLFLTLALAACAGDEAAVEPAALQISIGDTVVRVVVGESTDVEVSLERTGYDGPVDVVVADLPPFVTAEAATIPESGTSATLRISAAPNAVLEGPLTFSVQAWAEGDVRSSADTTLYVAGLPGTPDYALGPRGVYSFDLAHGATDHPSDAILDSKRRLVIVGWGNSSGPEPTSAAWVVRLNADGSLDESFGSGGKVVGLLNGHPSSTAQAVVEDESGGYRILVYHYGSELPSCIAALDEGGDLIESFGTGGFSPSFAPAFDLVRRGGSTIAIGYTAATAIDDSGQIDSNFDFPFSGSVGAAAEIDNELLLGVGASDFEIYRTTANGAIDETFGDGGVLAFPNLPDHPAGAVVHQVEVGAAGTVVASGSALITEGFEGDRTPVLLRFDTDGSPDESFGNGGVALVLPEGKTGYMGYEGAVALDSQGRAITFVMQDSPYEWMFKRFLPDGSPDPSFGTDGAAKARVLAGTLLIDDKAGQLIAVRHVFGLVTIQRLWL
ncbi:MAG: hypothetical protein KJO07_25400 [Deltaproteobacteria bacterium]|nr:hypothetical protein [Deltaproteobacteria bacterium]